VLEGQPTKDVLPDLVSKVISQISGERLMRWGDCEVKFSRPLRWIVSLLGKTIVNVEIANLKASNKSRGHRILHPQEIEIKDAESYEATLKSAFVIVDPKKRKATIAEQVAARAKELGGLARQLDSGLLDEVINLTEWPSALVGEFEHDYLALPATLIETIMIHHQRYFPVEAADSKAEEHKLRHYH
jgi:glycyl-tRNA synthetase beta chain